MKDTEVTGDSLPPTAQQRKNSPIRIRRIQKALPIRITSGEVLLYSPPNIRSRSRPLISLGSFRDGTWALHFRQYVLDANSPSGIRITRDGASFTLDEVELAIKKARAMAALVPDAPVRRGRNP